MSKSIVFENCEAKMELGDTGLVQLHEMECGADFLKLYTTMPISKLAAFLELDEETLRTKLLCYKHKQRNLVWTKGTDALEGEFQSSSEVDFYVHQDMIHIADTKVARRYGDFFIRHIGKIEDLNRNVQALGSSKA